MPITPVQDKTIARQVQGRIAGRGMGPPCRILVQCIKGQVTLTGTVRYAHQKSTAVQAAQGVSGVKHIVDRLTVKEVEKY